MMSTECYEMCNGRCETCTLTDVCDAYKLGLEEEKNFPPLDKITREDIWYARTDGMYGDYPGGDIDYDLLGY